MVAMPEVNVLVAYPLMFLCTYFLFETAFVQHFAKSYPYYAPPNSKPILSRKTTLMHPEHFIFPALSLRISVSGLHLLKFSFCGCAGLLTPLLMKNVFSWFYCIMTSKPQRITTTYFIFLVHESC